MVEGRAGRTWSPRSFLYWAAPGCCSSCGCFDFGFSQTLVTPCSGVLAVDVLWTGGLCWWVSLGGLSEIKPCGRRNTNFWQAEVPGLWGHLCATQDAGSFLAPREAAAAVAHVAFPGVQRNSYHPSQMEGNEGLERGTCPTSLLQDWLAFPNPSFWSLLTILSAAVTSSPLDLWTAAWGERAATAGNQAVV